MNQKPETLNPKLETILLTAFFLILILPAAGAGAETITIIDNINHSQAKVQTIVEDEIRFVSISELARVIHLSVRWDAIQKKVAIKDGGEMLSLTVDQVEAKTAKKTYRVAPPPQLIEGRVFVPIDFVVTILDSVFQMQVDWYKAANILSIKPKASRLITKEPSSKEEAASSEVVKSEVESFPTEPSIESLPMKPIDVDAKSELPSLGLVEDEEEGSTLERIVIDPGHGGNDEGVKGISGMLEKDVVLDLAKDIRSILLTKFPDLVVTLTREADVSLDLDQRINLANSKRADLFISLHLGASSSPKIGGFRTYYCGNLSPEKKQYNVREKAAKLAEIIQQVAAERFEEPVCPPQPAPLYGLADCFMPAVLVEVAFSTNPWDEIKLKNKVENKKIVTVLLDAITRYKGIREIEGMGF